MKKTQTTKQADKDQLPPTVADDELLRSYVEALDHNIAELQALIESGADTIETYRTACGRLWGFRFAKRKLLELAHKDYAELTDEE